MVHKDIFKKKCDTHRLEITGLIPKCKNKAIFYNDTYILALNSFIMIYETFIPPTPHCVLYLRTLQVASYTLFRNLPKTMRTGLRSLQSPL